MTLSAAKMDVREGLQLCANEDPLTSCIHYRTKMLLEKRTFTWTIENFSFCATKLGDKLYSERFPCNEDSKYKWFLQLFPYGREETDRDYISCFLYSAVAPKPDFYAKYFLVFRDSKNNDIEMINCDVIFHSPEGRGCSRFMKRSHLLRALKGDSLNIHVEVTVSIDNECSYNEISLPDSRSPAIKLAKDLGKLLKDPKFSDVAFRVDGIEIPAHQGVLSVRSDVFAAMFTHETVEKSTQRVEIKDFDSETIQNVLNFIYEGTFPKCEVSPIMDLLRAADKYNLQDLKAICRNYLISRIDTLNVVDFMILADMHNETELKDKALEYVITNIKFLDLQQQRSRLVENGNLLVDILEKLSSTLNT